MANLGEIVEELRMAESSDPGQESEKDLLRRNSTKRKRPRKGRISGGSQSSTQAFSSDSISEERKEENESGRQSTRKPVDGQKQDALPSREDYKARFYDDFREVAEEYDKEFIKGYNEDLNTTLIFAGLFSAVASAFIIQVDSQLQPDPGDETAALLRVLIYKIDNTTFGNDVPSLPQWTGPPSTMVQVQAILFSSLAASLLSAFLAMLGKQWLNRYESTDMRGSAIERGQDRQRKLDGINNWCFDFLMESLPVMLQVALLLLGCALSRYLWEVNTTIALVVLTVTSFGLLFYLFILVAGTVWGTCPYQTPGSRFFRYVGPKISRIVHSAASPFRKLIGIIARNARRFEGNNPSFLGGLLNRLPPSLVAWGLAAIKALHPPPVPAHPLICRAYNWLHGAPTTLEQGLDNQQIVLELRCISWTLQTSLNEPVRLTTLEHLVTIAEFPAFDPTLITTCFNIFVGCISVSNGKVAILQGMEPLATLSARCFLHALHYPSAERPTPNVLADLRRRYSRSFPFNTDFLGLPFYHTAANIHVLASQQPRYTDRFEWARYKLSNQELIQFARYMVEAAQGEYQQKQNKRVPRWILRFALHFLSLDPPPPTSVIADCLTIIAIALDHDPSGILISDESVRVGRVSSLITQTLETMAEVPDTTPIFRSKRKAVSALFPYAVHLAQGGRHGTVDAILRVASKSTLTGFMWRHTERYFTTLFDESSPPSLNQAIALAAPLARWGNRPYTQNAFARWAVAVLAIPYSEVDPSVVDALLQIASVGFLRPHIPLPIWARLKRLPSLPPVCRGRYLGTSPTVVNHIRGLGDIELLKSYLLLVWSEWNTLSDSDVTAMKTAIRETFSGIAMRHQRKDLTERLGYILGQLDQGLGYFKEYELQTEEHWIKQRKKQYRRLLEVLQEVNGIFACTDSLSSPHIGAIFFHCHPNFIIVSFAVGSARAHCFCCESAA